MDGKIMFGAAFDNKQIKIHECSEKAFNNETFNNEKQVIGGFSFCVNKGGPVNIFSQFQIRQRYLEIFKDIRQRMFFYCAAFAITSLDHNVIQARQTDKEKQNYSFELYCSTVVILQTLLK